MSLEVVNGKNVDRENIVTNDFRLEQEGKEEFTL